MRTDDVRQYSWYSLHDVFKIQTHSLSWDQIYLIRVCFMVCMIHPIFNPDLSTATRGPRYPRCICLLTTIPKSNATCRMMTELITVIHKQVVFYRNFWFSLEGNSFLTQSRPKWIKCVGTQLLWADSHKSEKEGRQGGKGLQTAEKHERNGRKPYLKDYKWAGEKCKYEAIAIALKIYTKNITVSMKAKHVTH